MLLTQQRTLQRKIEEASLALQLERTYSKQYILEQYLNTIFFGNRAYGVQMASRTYFGHAVDDPPTALAARGGAARRASSTARRCSTRTASPTLAIERRNLVLEQDGAARLHHRRRSAPRRPARRSRSPATPRTPDPALPGPPLRRAGEAVHPQRSRTSARPRPSASELLLNGGLKIYTTIDLDDAGPGRGGDQAGLSRPGAADHRQPQGPRRGPRRHRSAHRLRPGDGRRLRLLRHRQRHPQLRAGQPRRPAGGRWGRRSSRSRWSPPLTNGIDMSDSYSSPGSAVIRIPGYAPWSVSGDNLGRASLTQCTIHSANVCFANLMADERVLPPRVTAYAAAMGIDVSSNFDTVPSEVLGTNNTTVLEMTAAYGTFANNGVFVPPVMVTKVVRADGSVVYQNEHEQRKVLEPARPARSPRRCRACSSRAPRTAEASTGPLPARPARRRATPTPGSSATRPSSSPASGPGTPPRCRRAERSSAASAPCPAPGATMAAPVWQAFMKTALAERATRGLHVPAATAAPGAPTTTAVPTANDSIFELPSNLPKLVTMPTLVPGDTDQAASKARRAGLRVRRVNVEAAGVLRGQVLVQSPPAGTKLPSGSEVVIEATAGDPPPKDAVPDVRGRMGPTRRRS